MALKIYSDIKRLIELDMGTNIVQYIKTEYDLSLIEYNKFVVESLESPMRVTFSDGTKLTYIHNPRCGGYPVLHYLFKRYAAGDVVSWDRGDKEQSIGEFKTALSLKSLDSDLGTTFTIVRNPYTRLRSAYEHYYLTMVDLVGSRVNIGFNGYLETGLHVSDSEIKPQSKYLEGCDIVLSYEDLDNEFISKIVTPYFDLSKGGLTEKVRESFDGARDDESFIYKMTDQSKNIVETLDSFVFDNYGYTRNA